MYIRVMLPIQLCRACSTKQIDFTSYLNLKNNSFRKKQLLKLKMRCCPKRVSSKICHLLIDSAALCFAALRPI